MTQISDRLFARPEEGQFAPLRKRVMERSWNGGQADHGLNIAGQVLVLEVRLGPYLPF